MIDESLTGRLVSLRAVEPDDLDMLFLLENDPDRSQTSFTTAPASRQQLWEYIHNYQADIFAEKQLRLIVASRESGRPVGAVDISDFDPRDRRGFVGIAILEGERGKGYALDALDVLGRFASQTLGMHQLAAIVSVDNAASCALFHAAGYRTAGRLRSWIRRGRSYTDAQLFQRLFL